MDLGPNAQGRLPKKQLQQLLDVLGQREELVLWLLEGAVEYVPRNVRLLEKAPHLSILS